MTERERLIEILKVPIYPKEGVDPAEVVADYLLDNGVIVPPVKVGQTVWRVDDCIECVAVDKVVIKHGGIYMKLSCNSMYETSCRSIGKTVFLTKEEAEREIERKKEVEDVSDTNVGEWIKKGLSTIVCSACEYIAWDYHTTPYCPHCGARMKGGE